MNSVLFVVIAAMILVVVLLRFKVLIGVSILSGGLLIWLLESRSFESLWLAAVQTFQMQRTWDLLFCLYFVMCLEVQLRRSGSLHGIVVTLRNIFSSNKVTLAFMPAFLGLLPSIGGARFSAPIVQEASDGIAVSDEDKSAINLWFRHICEFSNPLMPGIILACAIANVTIAGLIEQVGWVTILSFILGWVYLVRPLKITDVRKATNYNHEKDIDWRSLILAFGPILTSFLLIVGFNVQAALAMGLVVVGFIPLYFFFKRPVKVRSIFLESLDKKLFINVILILYFIQILTVIGTLDEIVEVFKNSSLPIPIIIASLAFIFGMMTGMSQGYIAIVMPVVALLSPGDLVLAGITMVYGVAGQMITPTHMCILITVDYFKCSLWKTIAKCGVLSFWMAFIFSVWTYFRYYY